MLSDDVGVLQHATENVPNRAFGYCTDDVARAFVVALQQLRLSPNDKLAQRLAATYLAFLHHAQLDDGRFHNFMDYDRTWLDEVGTHDSCGRAIWALGYGVANAPTESWRRVCAAMLDRALASLEWLEYIRSRAYAAIGLAAAQAGAGNERYAAALRRMAGEILASYEATASDDWRWFETRMTYDNARLPEALIRAGSALSEPRLRDAGLEALAFYEGVTLENGIHVPIGNDGWYERGGGARSLRPAAARGVRDGRRRARGIRCHWRRGPLCGGGARAGMVLRQEFARRSRWQTAGGCYDGLGEDGVNTNMGAESTLALLSAAYTIAARRARVLRAVR